MGLCWQTVGLGRVIGTIQQTKVAQNVEESSDKNENKGKTMANFLHHIHLTAPIKIVDVMWTL